MSGPSAQGQTDTSTDSDWIAHVMLRYAIGCTLVGMVLLTVFALGSAELPQPSRLQHSHLQGTNTSRLEQSAPSPAALLTETPTVSPSSSPTVSPSSSPTVSPSSSPTVSPNFVTEAPTVSPSSSPTVSPSSSPTVSPSSVTEAPSQQRTDAPAVAPSSPTLGPLRVPYLEDDVLVHIVQARKLKKLTFLSEFVPVDLKLLRAAARLDDPADLSWCR